MSYDSPDLDKAWQALAWWANSAPRPQPPWLILGLPGVNAVLMEDYRCQIIAWKLGKAEALMQGLKEQG